MWRFEMLRQVARIQILGFKVLIFTVFWVMTNLVDG
jgi:hypothetical protein